MQIQWRELFKQRRRLTLERKQQLIQEIKNTDQVARCHGIKPELLYRWMKQAEFSRWQYSDPTAKVVTAFTPSPQEFRTLKSENKQLMDIFRTTM